MNWVAKVNEPAEARTTLSDREREAFEQVFDLLIPADFSILSFNKDRVIKSLMKIVEDDITIIRLKMGKVLRTLEKCYESEKEEKK